MKFSGEWIALCREAAISGQSISLGLNSLRKANCAMTGLYSYAFFSLSIGFERLLKLIFLIDHKIKNGEYPEEKKFREDFNHDIYKLYKYALTVHKRLPNKEKRYEISSNGIENNILIFLSKFAKTTRYYNLNYLSDRDKKSFLDPISEWYNNIGKQIIDNHYSIKQKQKDNIQATKAQKFYGDFVLVRHTAEDGSSLDDLESLIRQSDNNKIVQKYGTFYCAKIARFLYIILHDISFEARKHDFEIPYLDEMFFPFMNEDKYLLSRKTFPPRGQ